MRTPDQRGAIICDRLYSAIAALEAADEATLRFVSTEIIREQKEQGYGWGEDNMDKAAELVFTAFNGYAQLLAVYDAEEARRRRLNANRDAEEKSS